MAGEFDPRGELLHIAADMGHGPDFAAQLDREIEFWRNDKNPERAADNLDAALNHLVGRTGGKGWVTKRMIRKCARILYGLKVEVV